MSHILVQDAVLRDFVFQIARAGGIGEAAASLLADSLVAANLRGVDSHGVQLLPFYMDQVDGGRVDPAAVGRVISESGTVMLYDGMNGLGQVIAETCCSHAVRLAREHGTGFVVARESNHFGAAAWWGRRIASEGCLAMIFCNASPSVAPWQGREPRWGTNPICVSLPGPDGGSWLLDMATTTVAMGKIYKANILGEPEIPQGWAMDSDGRPTTSTQAALSGALMPLGGYKGSGLAMMVEILSAVLSGGAMSTEMGGLRIRTRPFRVNQTFLAVDISRLLPLEEFTARVRKLVTMVKSSQPAPGYDEVLVAGEPEWRTEDDRRRGGIPLERGHWDGLLKLAVRYRVQVPPVG
ncbi:MAG: Ldh family oxidoreductase [Acidimicrobiia bacterium]|nr:Ldh family oxidoreductase [Acidimicrobiia bacterium]